MVIAAFVENLIAAAALQAWTLGAVRHESVSPRRCSPACLSCAAWRVATAFPWDPIL